MGLASGSELASGSQSVATGSEKAGICYVLKRTDRPPYSAQSIKSLCKSIGRVRLDHWVKCVSLGLAIRRSSPSKCEVHWRAYALVVSLFAGADRVLLTALMVADVPSAVFFARSLRRFFASAIAEVRWDQVPMGCGRSRFSLRAAFERQSLVVISALAGSPPRHKLASL